MGKNIQQWDFVEFPQKNAEIYGADRGEKGCIDEKPNFSGGICEKNHGIKRRHNFVKQGENKKYSQEYAEHNRVWKSHKILMGILGFSQFPQVFPQGRFWQEICILGLHKNIALFFISFEFFAKRHFHNTANYSVKFTGQSPVFFKNVRKE